MAKNYLTRFATSSDANVLTDAELADQPELASGFIPKSKASSKLIGKLIQNATAGSAALGEYIATKTQQDVSATDADLGTKLTNAITAHIKAEAPLASPTFTGTVTAPTFAGDLSGNATTATTATTANKTKAVLTLQMNGGSAQDFDGSTARTFNVTAAGIDALPTYGGTISGSLTVNDALRAASITATSDIRLKNIINRYSTQSALYNLSAVDFSFKDSDDSVHTGLIAQEVQELYPALVKEDERGYLSIDYCGVTALLVNDMKHLLNKISRLEQQIEAIKRDI